MKNNRILCIALICAVVILGLLMGRIIGHDRETDKRAKTFSFHGMEITLPDDFEQVFPEDEAYSDRIGFQSADVRILALEEKYTMYPDMEAYTVDAYAKMTLEMGNDDLSLLQYDDGLIYCAREGSVGYSFLTFYADEDGFWEILFLTDTVKAYKYHDLFLEWAHTVTFSE